jgi:predicted DNA-binding protein with PD1-like motif
VTVISRHETGVGVKAGHSSRNPSLGRSVSVLKEYGVTKVYQGSLKKGDDLVPALTAILKEAKISVGAITGIGAVTGAELGYFNKQTKAYEKIHIRENLEIVSLKGNISTKDNEAFPHLHAVLSKKDFSVVGGHLFAGTVYAFEFEILVFAGKPFARKFDEATGLYLWKE